ncbi:IQ domain-containing protein K-like [Hylaeus anthracinus]|uniref:IQ domain-containing protein K-like n=1 Tax=Hylaeus anthracinus TaxID=313031 RepID=UPI0023B9D49A|nr:IQ domain-containing protein K-like [Hylaeus anthracinus]
MCNASPKGIQEISINESSCIASLQSDDTDVCRKFCGNGEEEALTAGRERDQSSYVEERIFHLLLPALEETLFEASKWNALRVQKCRFSGLDYLAEILWNRNPRRSRVFSPPLNAADIPLFKQWLRLRPPYPKSWLWSEDEAALHLQRFVRGWLVRKRTDVQEMRQFWKVNKRNTTHTLLDRFFIYTVLCRTMLHSKIYNIISHYCTS